MRLAKNLLVLMMLLGFSLFLSRGSQFQEQTQTLRESQLVQGSRLDAPLPGGHIPQREPPAGVSSAELAASAPPPSVQPGTTGITLEQLSSYEYVLNTDGTPGERADGSLSSIPPEMERFHKMRVSVSGFMIPLKMSDGKVSDFVLVKNRLLCCFGQSPRMNEWILVKMDPPVQSLPDRPVTVVGTLYVEEAKENGQVLCLYRIEGTDLMEMEPAGQ